MSRPKVDASDVDALTDAVLTASRLLVAVSARSLAAVEETITLPQFRLLVILDSRGMMRLTSLAELLDVNPSTVTRMVDRLVTTGMIARQANPATRREVVVDLTAEGRRVVRGVTRRRRSAISRIVARMSEDERRGLVGALAAFTEAGGEPAVTAGDQAWI
ncbi:DNA-binding transcriptional regulator, MarR family [Lentzea albidocapillata subsp. violacea]|uniref:DNA-binding transcriptional regulator, MarR family n=1 Tax=Lentzea albidocapillata subsp. violacea TaxID=128104 RepID=A0A1G8TRX1_9PSEU|nr:MarR family transcriptional regulator [Lentzea albidocapillata]SDJ44272.1 DNA-binding transcriptional regulator, MarR family [Lentzea albidocapillata subsp. violacea]